MRDEKWLFSKLDEVWDNYFPDIPQDNNVRIVWGRKAKRRLGSIKQEPSGKISNNKYQITNNLQIQNFRHSKLSSLVANPGISIVPSDGDPRIRKDDKRIHPDSIITINSFFKDEKIPEFVVIGTIAHELAHYAHGFNSPLTRKFANPHQGGVVHKELNNRGLEKMLKAQKKWLKENWNEYLKGKVSPSKTRKRRRVIIKWI